MSDIIQEICDKIKDVMTITGEYTHFVEINTLYKDEVLCSTHHLFYLETDLLYRNMGFLGRIGSTYLFSSSTLPTNVKAELHPLKVGATLQHNQPAVP